MPTYNSNKFAYVLLFLAILISTSLMLVFFWIADDAYISFRFAKNFANGHGLRYNIANEIPVEGYSNILWVWLAAAFEYFSIPSYQVIPYFSIFLAAVLVWRVFKAAQNYFQLEVLPSALAAISVALFPPVIIWGSSGLEPIPFTLLIFLVFEELFFKKNTNLFLLCVYGLGLSLIRVEGALWALTYVSMAILFVPEKRKLAFKFAVFIIAIIIVHTAWRYSYYQAWLPNTASTKVAFSSDRLVRGFNYIFSFLLTFIVPLIAICALFIKPNRLVLLSSLGLVGFYAYSVISGGDYMTMGRFLLPTVGFQAILLSLLIDRLCKKNFLFGLVTFCIITLIAIAPLFKIHLVPENIRAKFHFRLNSNRFWDEMTQWAFMKENARRWRHKGELLKASSQPGDSLIEGTIGAVGYFSELYIYDRLGLVSKLGPEFIRTKIRSAGHDKKAPLEYFLVKEPTYAYANLDRLDRFRRIKELENRYPYAPFVYPANYAHKEKYVFIVLKKVTSEAEFNDRWAELKNSVQTNLN